VTRFTPIAAIVIGALSTPGFALAQTPASAPTHVPLQKTIGAVAKPEVVPSLIVFNSRGANLQGGKLVLSGIAPNAIAMTPRRISWKIGTKAATTSPRILRMPLFPVSPRTDQV
jgi:hypothetical protein